MSRTNEPNPKARVKGQTRDAWMTSFFEPTQRDKAEVPPRTEGTATMAVSPGERVVDHRVVAEAEAGISLLTKVPGRTGALSKPRKALFEANPERDGCGRPGAQQCRVLIFK